MDTRSLVIFSDVMQSHCFTTVAKRRGISASSVSRVISSLESELGFRLFHRTTRHTAPTEIGKNYYENIKYLIKGLEDAKLLAKDMTAEVTGVLRITLPVSYGNCVLNSYILEFSNLHRKLTIDVMFSDSNVDLITERMDLAIRLGSLSDSSYIAKRLHTMEFIICASPEYLRHYGEPREPADTKEHSCLIFSRDGYSLDWIFKNHKDNSEQSVSIQGRLKFNNTYSIKECAKKGAGLALLPDWLVKQDIVDGKLIPIFQDYSVTASGFDQSVWLIYQSRAYLPKKVRFFIDYITSKIH